MMHTPLRRGCVALIMMAHWQVFSNRVWNHTKERLLKSRAGSSVLRGRGVRAQPYNNRTSRRRQQAKTSQVILKDRCLSLTEAITCTDFKEEILVSKRL